ATLLEVMIALAILATAGLGTLAGLTAAGRDLREGELNQGKMLLLDAKMERLLLQSKVTLAATPGGTAGYPAPTRASPLYPPNKAFGAAPWQLDIPPTVPYQPDDLSNGAYFTVSPNGQIVKLPPFAQAINGVNYPAAPVTPCGTVLSLPGISTLYCR